SKTSTKSSRFSWYGIAAGFIGILFISVLYFTLSESSVGPETKVSGRGADSILIDNTPEIILQKQIVKEEALVETETQDEKSTKEKSTKDKSIEDKSGQDKFFTARDNFKSKASTVTDLEDRKPAKVALPLNASEELIHTKVAEIVARVEVLENNSDSVTDSEIDSLLRSAQREILADKIFRKDNSIDAVALLADVEDELDQSFRDQIFDALKDGFLKVRTAVADRNK
ncbi:MAG: hypothetical protein WA913_15285, partial [Pricia sp.]